LEFLCVLGASQQTTSYNNLQHKTTTHTQQSSGWGVSLACGSH
jgi:hypothetical protein